MARRFFRSSIQELETLFKENHNNVDILFSLEEELSHRKTERAARLRNQVEERLVVLRPSPSSREQTSAELPPFRSSQHQSVSSSQEEQQSSHPYSTHSTTPIVDEPPGVGGAPPPLLPPITNQPNDVLLAWTALEVLSPPLTFAQKTWLEVTRKESSL
jgi:hypothetical protein